jgi:hypothetical protein
MNATVMLERCDQISNLSALMLAAARAGNWQEFDRLKQCTTSAIAEVRVLSETVSLSDEEWRAKLASMQEILVNEGCIQEISEPWLARLARWLPGGNSTNKHPDGMSG